MSAIKIKQALFSMPNTFLLKINFNLVAFDDLLQMLFGSEILQIRRKVGD